MKTKTKIQILLTICALFAVICAYNAHKEAQMNEYAKINNCTWYASGTFYGDNRDFVCK